MKKTQFFLILIFLPFYVFAEHKVPVFNNFYYLSYSAGGVDACGMQIDRQYMLKGSSLDEIVGNILTKYPDCVWSTNYTKRDSDWPPQDFPGTRADWNDIQKKSPDYENHMVDYRSACVDAKGDIIHSMGGTISPSYTCPSKTHVSLVSGGPSYETECETNPRPCEADVVARNMNMALISGLGHMGLIVPNTSTAPSVIEYEPTTLHVSTDSGIELKLGAEVKNTPFKEFYNKKPFWEQFGYWGDRFGLPQLPADRNHELTDKQALAIIMSAIEQENYPQFFDFFNDSWYPGMYRDFYSVDPDSHLPIVFRNFVSGHMRCDSFVYHAYSDGAGLAIDPDTDWDYTPKTLFPKTYACRQPQPDPNNDGKNKPLLCGNDSVTQLISYVKSPLIKEKDNEQEIINILASKNIFSQEASEALSNFYDDATISRLDKMNFLWKLALQYRSDPYSFAYLLEGFSMLRPLELTDQIISDYYQPESPANQIAIINMFNIIVLFKTQQDVDALTSDQINDVVKIKRFLESATNSATNSVVLSAAIIATASADPSEKTYNLISQIFETSKANAPVMALKYKNLILISLALSSGKTQATVLPELLNKNGLDSSFYKTVSFLLSKTNPEDLTDGAKNLLKERLMQHEPALNNIASMTDVENYYTWLKAFAAVNANNDQQKYSFIANKLIGIEDVALLENLIFVADKETINAINMATNDFLQQKMLRKGNNNISEQLRLPNRKITSLAILKEAIKNKS